uniref:60S ribosomal protein L17 n=1 Tax=Coccolithus braarudii TaxID=221442 RepID=A0A7S0PY74_9EUKA|eukprot:CAMPEP_0183359390 /NCGR_PEP_ID=MMETSP0164_2-20130417/52049_1 /TAXON_ID=221442 /ORGANISM="Coccolithus pelagicus ssp braarudi, Strain PLY182g" /LENGTH=184 /DNA_ID=CAMNT_0025533481 /DNA_START=42 /DNA_END=596 /DNA_ORIENTATION=+
MGKKNKYSFTPKNPQQAVKASGSDLRVSYKNTRETAAAIKGLSLQRAQRYLKDVLAHKDAIPYRRHCGNIGRHAMGKKYKNSGNQCRWPEKSCRFLLDLLQNAESNAELQNLDPETLTIVHIQVNRARKMRRRTYRAHGRIGPYLASPCHIELILSAADEQIARGDDDTKGASLAGRIESGATA